MAYECRNILLVNCERVPGQGTGVVYLIRDAETGKNYVGSSSNFWARWRTHDRNGHMKGTIEVVERDVDLEILLVREAYWQEVYNSRYPQGLNRSRPLIERKRKKQFLHAINKKEQATPIRQLLGLSQ